MQLQRGPGTFFFAILHLWPGAGWRAPVRRARPLGPTYFNSYGRAENRRPAILSNDNTSTGRHRPRIKCAPEGDADGSPGRRRPTSPPNRPSHGSARTQLNAEHRALPGPAFRVFAPESSPRATTRVPEPTRGPRRRRSLRCKPLPRARTDGVPNMHTRQPAPSPIQLG